MMLLVTVYCTWLSVHKMQIMKVTRMILTHQVCLTRRMVLLCAHADQAIVIEENPKRVTRSDEDVDTQVKLIALHQKGLVQVLLNNKVLLGWQLLTVTDKRDPGWT